MPILERPSRNALVLSAAGSTVTTVAPGNYTTTWSYRDGFVSTTDPTIASLSAVGFAAWGLAALVEALSARPIRKLRTFSDGP